MLSRPWSVDANPQHDRVRARRRLAVERDEPVLHLRLIRHVALLVDVREVELGEAGDDGRPHTGEREVHVGSERDAVGSTLWEHREGRRRRPELGRDDPLLRHRLEPWRHDRAIVPGTAVVVLKLLGCERRVVVVGRRVASQQLSVTLRLVRRRAADVRDAHVAEVASQVEGQSGLLGRGRWGRIATARVELEAHGRLVFLAWPQRHAAELTSATASLYLPRG